MKQKKIYLIANYFAKPKNPKKTHIKGYMKDPANIAWDESVIVTAGLKDRDLLSSRVVLNISEQKVERNTFGNDKSFMELFEYFYTASPTSISQALQRLGVTIGKPDEQHVQEDVCGQAEEDQGSVVATSAESAEPSQGN